MRLPATVLAIALAPTCLAQCPPDELVKHEGSGSFEGDAYGWAVAADGGVAIVGACATRRTYSATQPMDASFQSAAYVLREQEGVWTEEARLASGELDDRFGASVAINGETALVGALDASSGSQDDAGAVYVSGQTYAGAAYVFKEEGGAWTLEAVTTALGGTLLVDPSVALPLELPATGLTLSPSIPDDPDLCGLAFFLQALEHDPGASRGVSFTRGLELTVGS
ncbi:MAG: FG-GAP repeat protein [Planctomycetota bacterium]